MFSISPCPSFCYSWHRSDFTTLISCVTIYTIDVYAGMVPPKIGGECSKIPRLCLIASGVLTVATALFQAGLHIHDWRKDEPESTLRRRVCVAVSISLAIAVQSIASWGILRMCVYADTHQ